MGKVPSVVIDVHNGVVTNVHSNQEVRLIVINHDSHKTDHRHLNNISHDGSDGIDEHYVAHIVDNNEPSEKRKLSC